jgi:hypothetical protein
MKVNLTPEAAASYTAAAGSVVAGFTLQDYAIVLGMFIAVATYLTQLYFSIRRASDYKRVIDATIGGIESKKFTTLDPAPAEDIN